MFKSQLTVLTGVVVLYVVTNVACGLDQLKYLWGDAMDDPLANGPDGNPYPWDKAAKIASKQRTPRFFADTEAPQLLSPSETRNILLKAFQAQEQGVFLPGTSFMPSSSSSSSASSLSSSGNVGRNHRQGRGESSSFGSKSSNYNNDNYYSSSNMNNISSAASPLKSSHKNINSHNYHNNHPNGGSNKKQQHGDFYSSPQVAASATLAGGEPDGCVPSRLCASTYNTTAPLYGVSLTSGQPVTIVQKFPDLLQQVVFQVCKTTECEVIHGECVQTYLPYLFLVIPLGPVTLTGQDYVLVESGCVCRPKYARRHDEPPPLPFIQALQN